MLNDMKFMETIKIDNKEYQIDTERALELGVLKEKNPYNSWKVKSWDEYVKEIKRSTDNCPVWYGMPNIPESNAFRALGQLIHLRDAWWGKWKPNWNNIDVKHVLYNNNGIVKISTTSSVSSIFAFPTAEMAQEFYNTHKELIIKAKMFL